MIDNRFNHKTTEKKCISYWQKNKTFEFEKKGTDTFCIMMPPLISREVYIWVTPLHFLYKIF